MAHIKHVPEDFIVKEITAVRPEESGEYCYFWLKKRDYTTHDALRRIADALRLPLKRFGFAGSKDRVAVTEQVCSVFGVKKERIEGVRLRDIELRFFGYGKKPVSLGDLAGNAFQIVVRDLSNQEVLDFQNKLKNKKTLKTINYFDEQRFSDTNAQVGRAIVKGDFGKAVGLIAQGSGNYNLAVKSALEKNNNDFVGALRHVPRKILLMMVHAYQSFLWNETAAAYTVLSCKNVMSVNYSLGQLVFSLDDVETKKIPVVGFGTEIKDREIKKIVDTLLKKEKINMRDFIVRKIPELSVEGDDRDLAVEAKDFGYAVGEDEINEGKKKVTLSFTLPKGSYATIVVKNIFY